MGTLQFPIGTTMSLTHKVRLNGILTAVPTGCHLMFKLMKNIGDPDNACLALLDNQTLGGVTAASPQSGDLLGSVYTVVPDTATYGMPNQSINVYWELWGNPNGVKARLDKGTITLTQRGLVQQP